MGRAFALLGTHLHLQSVSGVNRINLLFNIWPNLIIFVTSKQV